MKFAAAIEIICFLLILLFVYAAFSKLLDYPVFRIQLRRSPIISHFPFLSWLLPGVEIITAIMLTVKITRLPGLYASLILLILFSIYITLLLLFSKHLPCSCGGVLKQMSWQQHLLFNISFIALSIVGIMLQRKYQRIVI